MSRNSEDDAGFIASQQRMLRLAERDCGLTPAVICLETGIPKPTIMSWRKEGASAISGPNLVRLATCIPNELLSLLFEPAGKCLGDCERAEDDIDQLACEAAGLVYEIIDAKSDGIITPQERANIGDRARRVAAKASAVAR